MTTKRVLGRERLRFAVPAYALQRKIPVNEVSILFQLLEELGSLAGLEEILELLHSQRAFRPGFRKYLFRLLNYCALMVLFVISSAGTTINGVPQQNLYIIGLLTGIAVVDGALFTIIKRPDLDVREKRLMDRWAGRSVATISANPSFCSLKLSGVERQEMARLVMQDTIDRAPDGLL